MALELLSGPNWVHSSSDPNPLGVIRFGITTGRIAFVEPRGIMYTDVDLTRTMIQPDGTSDPCGKGRRAYNAAIPALLLVGASTDGPRGGRQWYAEVGGALPTTNPLHIWERNPVTLVGTETVTPPVTMPTVATLTAQSNLVVLHDRLIRATGSGGGSEIGVWDGASWTTEAVLPFANAKRVSWASEAGRIWVSSTDGQAVQYDYVDREVVGTPVTIGMGCLGLWYWRKHSIFISLHVVSSGSLHDFNVRVWSTTPAPSALSAPVASPALTQGRVSTVATTLTSDNGEPCVGEVVGWTASAGTLSNSSSVTDDTGTASVRLLVPSSEAGPIDVDAEVRF